MSPAIPPETLAAAAQADFTFNTDLRLGSEVPDFRLPDKGGTEVSLSEMRGSKVMISFCRHGY